MLQGCVCFCSGRLSANCMTQIPELSVFITLTLISQLPASIYSIFGSQYKVLASDKCLNIVFLVFVIPEVLIGYTTLCKFRESQRARFQLTKRPEGRTRQNLDAVEEIDAEVLI